MAIKPKICVLIVGDTALMRQGIKNLLEKHQDVEIVGEASSAEEAARMPLSVCPDMILLHHGKLGLDGVAAIRLIKQHTPMSEIIVLAERSNGEDAFRSLEAGAAGYLSKDVTFDALIRVMERVSRSRAITRQPRDGRLSHVVWCQWRAGGSHRNWVLYRVGLPRIATEKDRGGETFACRGESG